MSSDQDTSKYSTFALERLKLHVNELSAEIGTKLNETVTEISEFEANVKNEKTRALEKLRDDIKNVQARVSKIINRELGLEFSIPSFSADCSIGKEN